MLLRESGKKSDQVLDLSVITGAEGNVGIQHEAELLLVTGAVYEGDRSALAKVRQQVEPILGAQGLADAIGVASAFNGITRIANATGLPLDQSTFDHTIKMRQETGIDDYSEQHKVVLFE